MRKSCPLCTSQVLCMSLIHIPVSGCENSSSVIFASRSLTWLTHWFHIACSKLPISDTAQNPRRGACKNRVNKLPISLLSRYLIELKAVRVNFWSRTQKSYLALMTDTPLEKVLPCTVGQRHLPCPAKVLILVHHFLGYESNQTLAFLLYLECPTIVAIND
jgi:hypothetical protein